MLWCEITVIRYDIHMLWYEMLLLCYAMVCVAKVMLELTVEDYNFRKALTSCTRFVLSFSQESEILRALTLLIFKCSVRIVKTLPGIKHECKFGYSDVPVTFNDGDHSFNHCFANSIPSSPFVI